MFIAQDTFISWGCKVRRKLLYLVIFSKDWKLGLEPGNLGCFQVVFTPILKLLLTT